jgi:hypothetical protein
MDKKKVSIAPLQTMHGQGSMHAAKKRHGLDEWKQAPREAELCNRQSPCSRDGIHRTAWEPPSCIRFAGEVDARGVVLTACCLFSTTVLCDRHGYNHQLDHYSFCAWTCPRPCTARAGVLFNRLQMNSAHQRSCMLSNRPIS